MCNKLLNCYPITADLMLPMPRAYVCDACRINLVQLSTFNYEGTKHYRDGVQA